ncbi:MAG: tetratricopeptide repeat protein [Acidobacteria bacterium]|nr:tetratricopeptide repeat protein [Acidobacteriota bacterium]
MNKQTILVAIVTGLAGFIAGFMIANSLNRSELGTSSSLTQTAGTNQPAGAGAANSTTLSPDEIKARVDAADRNPEDFAFQKSLGISLYRYASLKQDPANLPDAIRIMQRALDLDPADRDLQIALGNAHFDVGYFKKENASLELARGFYNRALERVPGDVDVRTDLALTYYLQTPPDLDSAIKEFEQGLAINPKHERSLQFLTQTYVKKNDIPKANQTLERLKAVNPSSTAIAELTSMIAGGPASVK